MFILSQLSMVKEHQYQIQGPAWKNHRGRIVQPTAIYYFQSRIMQISWALTRWTTAEVRFYLSINHRFLLTSPQNIKIWIGSRRPSILPVPDMVTSSLNIASENQDDDVEVDESEDELEDDVPWRSPSEKIA